MPSDFYLTPSYAYPQNNKCEHCKQSLKPADTSKYNWIVAKQCHDGSSALSYHVKCLQSIFPQLDEFGIPHRQSNMQRIADKLIMLIFGSAIGAIPSGLTFGCSAMAFMILGGGIDLSERIIKYIVGTKNPYGNFETFAKTHTIALGFTCGALLSNTIVYFAKRICRRQQPSDDESLKVMKIYKNMIDIRTMALGVNLSQFAFCYMLFSLSPSQTELTLPIEIISKIKIIAATLGLVTGSILGQKNKFFSGIFNRSHEMN